MVKGTKATKSSRAYTEASTEELSRCATASLETYEYAKQLRMDLVLHSQALKHLARLTRVFALPHSHALLLSEEQGLGRTSLVRLAAFLAKTKYFEPRVSGDEAKSERYLRATLKQSCLVSGIKSCHSIIYVRSEFHAHRVLDNLCVFIKACI